MKIFSYDGAFARTMTRVFDLVLLHFLWILTSIPVVTIGASTAALFTVTMKMVKNEESYILRGYMNAFRENLKKATILWGIMVVVFLWLIFILRICMKGTASLFGAVGIVNAALFMIAFFTALYIFPIQAVYDNTVGNILKNALICSLRYLPYTLLMAAILLVPILVTGYVRPIFPVMIALWLFAGSSLIAYGESFIIHKVFEKVS